MHGSPELVTLKMLIIDKMQILHYYVCQRVNSLLGPMPKFLCISRSFDDKREKPKEICIKQIVVAVS